MKHILLAVLIIGLFLPSVTHASWWNPFTWKKVREERMASTTVATTTESSFALPTVDELQKRIAELEDKLDKTRAVSKKPVEVSTPKEVVKTATAPAETKTSGLSEKQISAKIKPAIVFVETGTGSATGIVINAQGHVLVPAHALWIQETGKGVTGAGTKATVTLADGSKKSAELVGLEEAHDVAILKLPEGGLPYVSLVYDSNVAKGDTAYVFGGSGSVAGTITRKDVNGIELSTANKPAEDGGILINNQGGLVGLSNKPVCKVLEEMTNCLKYTVTSDAIKTIVPKLLLGMKLYKNKQNSTATEALVRGQLDGVYRSMKDNSIIDYAIASASGKNSFDNFNAKLGQDQDGKMSKLYVIKLKTIAEGMYSAVESLKIQADNLNIFFINEESSIEKLDGYQRKILAEVRAGNESKLKEYQSKVNFWSKKKNEYDSYIAKPGDVTHDYLLEEGVFVESSVDYLTTEKKRILDIFSGETVNLF